MYIRKFIYYFKSEVVFSISLILALITSIMVKPKLNYINLKVLILMFNLMLIIAAFEKIKLLDKIAIEILSKNKNLRIVSAVLVGLCFIFSMFITNDVALITFVPLTIIIAKKSEFDPIKIIIFETLAANMGSSFTPMGNPQNLYLFSFYNINIVDFFKITVLLMLIGAIWLTVLIFRIKNFELNIKLNKVEIKNKNIAFVYCLLFILILFSVFNVIDYRITLIMMIVVSLILDRSLLKKVDYILLLTFICFFIVTGNLSNMQIVNEVMKSLLNNDIEIYFSSIFFSQIISNVPCAILLSKFTYLWQPILLGSNIGGMGTIIASLASLISYKFYSKYYNGKKYLMKFTKYNVVSLILFGGVFFIYNYLKI